MNAKSMAAWNTSLFNIRVVSLCLLITPVMAQAKSVDKEKSKLVTTADFVRYSIQNDVDTHDLLFSLRSDDGTESCLICHENEGAEMLDNDHFRWSGKSVNIVGFEDGAHGKNDLINNFCNGAGSAVPGCSCYRF